MKTIGIVACCKTKRASTQAARDLYCSPLFRKSVAYLRRFWCPTDNDWFILSAEHGLVASSQMIQPYDKTLHALTGSERKAWSLRVLMQFKRREWLPNTHRFVVMAGSLYRAPFKGYETITPLSGLRILQQMAFLNQGRRFQ